ncbi:MAG: tetratricopeptide repeat protein [Planctomycetota bacterium]
MKKDNRKHRSESRLAGLANISRVFWFCILCFTFMPLLLLASLVGIASASSTSETASEVAQSGSAITVDPSSPQQRELWQAKITVAQTPEDDTSKNELRYMIDKIRSVTFEPPRQAAGPVIVPIEVQSAEPAERPAEVTTDVKDKPKRGEPKPKLPYEPITEETLQMLRNLSKDPEKVGNPFELGETLFLSGNLEEAAVFYTEALRRTEPNDVDPSGNRAWMLLQTGNCLRNSDRPEAAKMYALLLTEYPNSPWAYMAQAQAQLIDWYLRDEPYKLIAEREQTGGQ